MPLFDPETMKMLVLVCGVAAVLYFLNTYYNRAPVKNEGEVEEVLVNRNGETVPVGGTVQVPSNPANKVLANSQADAVRAAGYGPEKPQGSDYSCFPSEELMSQDLLPLNDLQAWSENHPEGAGILEEKNFLSAGHHIGINSVGQALKNANYGIRSEPSNPQRRVSPWQNSSYSSDSLRRPLEIGSNC